MHWSHTGADNLALEAVYQNWGDSWAQLLVLIGMLVCDGYCKLLLAGCDQKAERA